MAALAKILVVGLTVFMAVGCGDRGPEHPAVTPDGDRIRIPLSTVDDGGVHFFTFKHDGKNVNFFIRTDGTGQLQAHFDACYSCFKYKRGYVREGNEVVCIACRIGYNLDDVVWDYIGACAPINLHSGISGKYIVIRLSSLKKGKRFF